MNQNLAPKKKRKTRRKDEKAEILKRFEKAVKSETTVLWRRR